MVYARRTVCARDSRESHWRCHCKGPERSGAVTSCATAKGHESARTRMEPTPFGESFKTIPFNIKNIYIY